MIDNDSKTIIYKINAQTCTLFTHDCDNWKFIITVNEDCMSEYEITDITEITNKNETR